MTRGPSSRANKALSPGINDPTTAVHALDHSSETTTSLATAVSSRRSSSTEVRKPDDGASSGQA
jgi:uncharacterized membrane protein